LNTTGDQHWRGEAQRAFDWFLGSNDLNEVLYDFSTGGCRDGLHASRANQNEGAESTLSFLLALAEMKALDNATAAFHREHDIAVAEMQALDKATAALHREHDKS
ncbi:MAG: hypothetical protein ACKOJB_09980, partial [Chthoniobacterales bacterium]